MPMNLLLSTLVSKYYEISFVKLELDCLEHFDVMHSLKRKVDMTLSTDQAIMNLTTYINHNNCIFFSNNIAWFWKGKYWCSRACLKFLKRTFSTIIINLVWHAYIYKYVFHFRRDIQWYSMTLTWYQTWKDTAPGNLSSTRVPHMQVYQTPPTLHQSGSYRIVVGGCLILSTPNRPNQKIRWSSFSFKTVGTATILASFSNNKNTNPYLWYWCAWYFCFPSASLSAHHSPIPPHTL